MGQFFKELTCDDTYDAKFRTPQSHIDHENNQIILRDMNFPKVAFLLGGTSEFVISNDIITVNTSAKNGIVSEEIHISQISSITVKLSGHVGRFCLRGEHMYHSVGFNVTDVLVAHAAYAYIVAKRQDDPQNPLKATIAPHIVEMRRQLDAGEIEPHNMEAMRQKGMLEAIGYAEPTPNPAPDTPEAKDAAPSSTPTLSAADEIAKLKALLDDGVLTQEEFDHKKKILLGM